jgi:hypothetical protein
MDSRTLIGRRTPDRPGAPRTPRPGRRRSASPCHSPTPGRVAAADRDHGCRERSGWRSPACPASRLPAMPEIPPDPSINSSASSVDDANTSGFRSRRRCGLPASRRMPRGGGRIWSCGQIVTASDDGSRAFPHSARGVKCRSRPSADFWNPTGPRALLDHLTGPGRWRPGG